MVETYDLKDYDSNKDDSIPPVQNVVSATDFVTDLFDNNGILYAVKPSWGYPSDARCRLLSRET